MYQENNFFLDLYFLHFTLGSHSRLFHHCWSIRLDFSYDFRCAKEQYDWPFEEYTFQCHLKLKKGTYKMGLKDENLKIFICFQNLVMLLQVLFCRI